MVRNVGDLRMVRAMLSPISRFQNFHFVIDALIPLTFDGR